MAALTIGRLAASAGVGIETIRYYRRRKLLGTPPKPSGGEWLYSTEHMDRLRFIKRAQALSFSLEDVAVLLQLNDGTGHARARALAQHRLDEIESRIADLAALEKLLERLVHDCEHSHRRIPCPVIATLLRDDTGDRVPRAGARQRRAPEPA
jgi:MerR family mercuric resistance operon transcriptional regulator